MKKWQANLAFYVVRKYPDYPHHEKGGHCSPDKVCFACNHIAELKRIGIYIGEQKV